MASISIRFRTGPKNSNSIAPSRSGTGQPATQRRDRAPQHRRIHDPNDLPRPKLQHRNPEGRAKPQPPRSGEDHLGAREEELPPPRPRIAAHRLPDLRWKRPGRHRDLQCQYRGGEIDHGPGPGGERGHLPL